MSRPAANPSPVDRAKPASSLESKLSLLTVALIGAAMSTSVLIAGDSITVTSGETLPQVLLILLLVFVASLAGWRILALRSQSTVPLILLAVAILCLVTSSIAASMRTDGRAAWNWFWHILAMLLLAITTAQVTWRPAMARALLHMIIMCAVFQTTFALYQYFVSMPADRAEYLNDPEAALLKAQLDAPPGSELRMQYESRLLGSYEPIGTFALTNTLAVLLSGVIIGLGNIVMSRRERSQVVALWAARAILLFIVGAWLLTKSRSGFLSVAIIASVALAMNRWRKSHTSSPSIGDSRGAKSSVRWMMVAFGVLGLIGLGIALLSSDRLVLSEAPMSILYRLEYWQATAKMILDYPLTGVGFGNFQSYYPAYKLPAASEVIADPHNWMFDLAVNGSIPLLITAVLALGWILRGAARQLVDVEQGTTNQPGSEDRALVMAFWIGTLVMFLLASFLQLLLGELINFDATALGWLAALGSWWLLKSLPASLNTVRQSAWLALMTMLVCLLSSGSWQASGIAIPMAVMLAIVHPSEPLALVGPWASRSAGALLCVTLSLLALVAFVWQTWQPVQSSWALEQQAIEAWQRGRPDVAVATVQQAIVADRLASSPRRLLAQISMEEASLAARRAAASDFAIAITRVDTNLESLLAHDPVSNLNHGYAGQCNVALAAACAAWDPKLATERMAQAAEHYRNAVQRYPTSVALQAELSVVQAWLDLGSDQRLSKSTVQSLEEAVRLSQLTPHSNRKLASQQVFLPAPLSDRFDPAAVVRVEPESPWAKAEPLCENLRKLMGN